MPSRSGSPRTSIHYRRRHSYALLGALLVILAGFLIRWETPLLRTQTALSLRLQVQGAPQGTRAQAWLGPRSQWPGAAWQGQGACSEVALTDSGAAVLSGNVRVAWRRWVKGDYKAAATTDLLMVKLTPPAAPPRYLSLALDGDIRTGLVRPNGRLITLLELPWAKASLQP